MSMTTFRNAFPHGTPRRLKTNAISDQLYDAGGNSLGCIGVFEMDFKILGRKFKHPVRVLQYVTEDIIGIDFINTHHLWYDTENREIFFNKTKNKATLSLMKDLVLPELSKSIIKVRYNGENQKGRASIATIRLDESCLITGGPALINILEQNLCYIEIKNCAPYEMRLERGSTIASVDN